MKTNHVASGCCSNNIRGTKLISWLVLGMLSVFLFASCQKDDDDNSGVPGTGAYTLSDGSTAGFSDQTFVSATADESAVKVTNGTLTLTNCTITKTGNTTSSDNSSFYGQNAAVLSSGSNSFITISGGSINTAATGANATVAYGGTITITDVTITCSGNLSRGIHATNGGTINATNLTATTYGANSSVIATDRGGGTVNVIGGNFQVSGADAAVIYSTGTITATGITGVSALGEAAVVEGSNYATINNCDLTAGSSLRGILMLQSGSGDAQGIVGNLSVKGGTMNVTGTDAPLVEVVTNSTGNVTLDGVSVTTASGVLMKADYNTRWTTSGATGNLTLQGTIAYTGNIEADTSGTVTVTVNTGTSWNGAFDEANTAKASAVTVSGGVWNLTANSFVDTIHLTDNATINKNGFTLTYVTLNNESGTINE